MIADQILYDGLLHPIMEAHSEIGPDESKRLIEADEEGFYLIATLIWYSFQRYFNYIGKNDIEFILNRFYNKIYGNGLRKFGTCVFRDRYQEYYPIIGEDIKYLSTPDIIPFRSLADAFFYKVVPNKKKSMDKRLLAKRIHFLFTYINNKYEETKIKKIL